MIPVVWKAAFWGWLVRVREALKRWFLANDLLRGEVLGVIKISIGPRDYGRAYGLGLTFFGAQAWLEWVWPRNRSRQPDQWTMNGTRGRLAYGWERT